MFKRNKIMRNRMPLEPELVWLRLVRMMTGHRHRRIEGQDR